MTASGEHLRHAVDAVLEPAWSSERRRAAGRLALASATRWAGGMAAITLLALLLFVATGVLLPVAFFAVVGLLVAVATLPDADDRAHLRRQAPGKRRRGYLLPRR